MLGGLRASMPVTTPTDGGDAATSKPKRKLSRKAQLREMASQRKARREPAVSEDEAVLYAEPCEAAEAVQGMEELREEDVGEEAQRQRNACKQRRYRERLRGVSDAAQFMSSWLEQARPVQVQEWGATLPRHH